MNWEVISAVAEVISAAAVVISLVYVGMQIRQSNELSRANTIHVTNTQYSHVMEQLAADSELAKLYRRATSGEELNEDEFVQYAAFMTSYFVFLEDVHIQESSGLFALELGASNVTEFMAREYSKLLCSPQSRHWWEEDAPRFLSPEFYEVATKNIQRQSAI